MKIQCERCKEIVPIGRFLASAKGIEVTCEACGESYFVDADSQTDATAPDAADGGEAGRDASASLGEDQMRCPKCDGLQPRRDACRSCGLRAELFDDYDRKQEEEAPPELEAIWETCRADWDDEDGHARFAECASSAFAYAYAARRYRSVLRHRPDDEIAHRQLDRLSRMAEASLMGASLARQQAEGEDEPYKKVIVLIMVLVLLAGIGGMVVLLKQAKDVGSETLQKPPTAAPTNPQKRPTTAPATRQKLPETAPANGPKAPKTTPATGR